MIGKLWCTQFYLKILYRFIFIIFIYVYLYVCVNVSECPDYVEAYRTQNTVSDVLGLEVQVVVYNIYEYWNPTWFFFSLRIASDLNIKPFLWR